MPITGPGGSGGTNTQIVSQSLNFYTGLTGSLPVTGVVTVTNFPTSYPGNTNITASIVLPVSQTNQQGMTSGAPVWITGSVTQAGGGNSNITASITLPVSMTNPVSISGAGVTSGGLNVWVQNQTSSSLSGVNVVSQSLSVYVVNQTSSSLSGVNVVGGGLQVFSSQSNPVWVTGSGLGGNTNVSVYVADDHSVSDTGTLTSASYSTSPAVFLSGNVLRAGLSIYNGADKELFLAPTASVSTVNFSYRIAPRAEFEMPPPLYRGPMYGVWSAGGTGQALITEYIATVTPTGAIMVSSTQANPVWVAGAVQVTSTQANPAWVTGTVTANVTIAPSTGTQTVSGTVDVTAALYAYPNQSLAGYALGALPATGVALMGYEFNNGFTPVIVDTAGQLFINNWPVTFPGNSNITASITLPVSATNPVTASIANWPATFPGNANITQSITLPVSMTNAVTSSIANFPSGFNANITASVVLSATIVTGSIAGSIQGNFTPVKGLVSGTDATLTVVAGVAYRVVATTDGFLRDGGTADSTYNPFFSRIPEVWAFTGTNLHVVLSASAATGSIWLTRVN